MGFTLSVKGKDTNIFLGKDAIISVSVNTATERTSLAKTNIVATMSINGKLLSNDSTFSEWKSS